MEVPFKNQPEKAGFNRRRVGFQYEAIAAKYLEEQGMVILEQNYRCMQGESDLIGQEGDFLVFVEVKYRVDGRNGFPAEAVTLQKQQHIRRTARYYLYSHRCGEIPCRFDVVSILGKEICWIRDAF